MRMEAKDISSALLLVSGGILALYGFMKAETSYLNLGIAGMFLAAVVYTFKPSGYVKKATVELLMKDYENLNRSFSENLTLEGKTVAIPPYENLPDGGIFIPLHDDFKLELARLDEKTVFLTEVPEKAMGLFLGPLGIELLKKFEEHFEGSLEGTGAETVESVSGAVFRTFGLAKRVYIEEREGDFLVIIQPEFELDWGLCERFPSPICSSLLLALAKATGELILVEESRITERGVELNLRKLGGVEEWM